jgi:hypothetical protein
MNPLEILPLVKHGKVAEKKCLNASKLSDYGQKSAFKK